MPISLGSKHFYLWLNYEYGSVSTECYDLFPDYQKEGYIFTAYACMYFYANLATLLGFKWGNEMIKIK